MIIVAVYKYRTLKKLILYAGLPSDLLPSQTTVSLMQTLCISFY